MAIDITEDESFSTVLDHHVQVDMTTTVQTAHLTTTQQKLAIDSDTLARRWEIPLNKAKRTVQRNTQEHCESDPSAQISYQWLHALI